MIYAAKFVTQSKDHKIYAAFRTKEKDGLIDRGVFMPVSLSDAKGCPIYGSCFVYCVKNEGTPNAYAKSRFIIQGLDAKQDLLTHDPTVMRASQRLFCACASNQNPTSEEE